ncbi:MAG: glycogen-binding domain-containing protein [Desulfobulbaceae bacterium]|nr:glycogen-binding domain-containing protein [Desulfobulbaceae bacterium]MCK5437855.1 glycogen-binding domain-containing protein [Desulfobulbaceae bacterium]MCK5545384.1 glycogen-binding domain-containing protein [Desulfobulbaceae bacterium]
MAKTSSKASEKKGKGTKTPATQFRLQVPDAKAVYLVGDFNEWNETEYRVRRYKGGVFIKKLELKPGRYEYKFVVDGVWTSDPANPMAQSNDFGSENSVIVVS